MRLQEAHFFQGEGAEIDVELVREELKKINDQQEKIPASMKKVLQTKNLPVKIAKITKTVSA